MWARPLDGSPLDSRPLSLHQSERTAACHLEQLRNSESGTVHHSNTRQGWPAGSPAPERFQPCSGSKGRRRASCTRSVKVRARFEPARRRLRVIRPHTLSTGSECIRGWDRIVCKSRKKRLPRPLWAPRHIVLACVRTFLVPRSQVCFGSRHSPIYNV